MRHRPPALAFLLLVALPARLGAGSAPASPPFPIWPIPREARVEDERLLLTDAVIVVPPGDRRAQWPGRLLAEIVADQFGVVLPVATGSAPEGRTPIVVGEASAPAVSGVLSRAGTTVPEAAEGYLIAIDGTGAVVAGRDERGALYGVSSFVQLVHRWGKQSVAVRRAVVRDWPFLSLRWVHLFLPGRDQLDFARRYMRDVLLRFKFNGIVLEVGGGMRLESHPEISVGWKRTVAEWYAHGETMDKLGEGIPLGTARRFAASLHVGVGGGAYVEKDDVRKLADLAQLYGLEVVPEVQSLAHTYYIASARRDVAEDPEMAWPDSYCPQNPESYRILFDDPKKEDALEHVGHLLPAVRGLVSATPPPSCGADPMRFEVLDVASAFNHAPKGEGWDLSGLKPGRRYASGLPYAIGDPAAWGGRSAVVVARRPGDEPTRVALPIRGRWASLVFVQSATGVGRPSIHAGDQTHFPRESSELLGFYEIRYEDELVQAHEIRYDETVGRWDAGLALPFYFARPLVAGSLPDGRAAVVWASEWRNPRPDVPIASLTLVGSPGPSNARPILLGVTAVEKPRVEDLR